MKLIKDVAAVVKDAALEWKEDQAPRFAAALSFYTLLSLAPVLLIVIALVGLAVGQTEAREAVVEQVRELMGSSGADAVETVLENAQEPSGGILSLVIGVVVLVFGATGVFGQLQTALNSMWEVRPKPGQGVWGVIRTRIISFSAIVGIGFILLVSLAVSAGLAAVGDMLGEGLPGGDVVLGVVNFLVSFAVISLLFALAFKILPDAVIRWRDVWVGAALTALLFVVGKSVIGLYLGRSSTSSSFAAAGSLVVLLIWVYYSAQIFFFGAEITQVYANRYGASIRPEEHAELVPEPPEEYRGGTGAQRMEGDGRREPREPGGRRVAPPGSGPPEEGDDTEARPGRRAA
jgi:membrane protein